MTLRGQRGAVAVAFIVLMMFLMGWVVFAADMARIYIARSELQNAADACALAAAAALTGSNTAQLAVAESYGLAVAARNKLGMQGAAVSLAPNAGVTFSPTVNGAYLPKNLVPAADAIKMSFARCVLTESNIASFLGSYFPLRSTSATATASMTPSISNCAIPLAVCSKAGSSAPLYGYAMGEWLTGRFNPGTSVGGKFKWVKFQGYERTSDLASLIATGGQCDLKQPTVGLQTGVINSLVDVWNWRFGVKKPSGAPAGAYPPDLSGYAYTAANWPSQSSALDDFMKRRAANTPWNGQPSLAGGWSASTVATHAVGSDRRMVVMPVVDCSSWDAGGTGDQPVQGWACALMLNPVSGPDTTMGLEYRGAAPSMNSGCVTSGAPGGPTATGPRVPTLVM